jgi:protein required for attachment to host cells
MIAWVLIVHGNAGRVLEINKKDNKIIVRKEFIDKAINEKGHEVFTDRPGRAFEGRGQSRHALVSETLVHHEYRAFSSKIMEYLNQAHLEHKFDSLVLVSSHSLLGYLRNEASDGLKKIISHELSKDLISDGLGDQELIEKIKEDLGVLHLF